MAGINPRILTVALNVDRLNTPFLKKEKEKQIVWTIKKKNLAICSLPEIALRWNNIEKWKSKR